MNKIIIEGVEFDVVNVKLFNQKETVQRLKFSDVANYCKWLELQSQKRGKPSIIYCYDGDTERYYIKHLFASMPSLTAPNDSIFSVLGLTGSETDLNPTTYEWAFTPEAWSLIGYDLLDDNVIRSEKRIYVKNAYASRKHRPDYDELIHCHNWLVRKGYINDMTIDLAEAWKFPEIYGEIARLR